MFPTTKTQEIKLQIILIVLYILTPAMSTPSREMLPKFYFQLFQWSQCGTIRADMVNKNPHRLEANQNHARGRNFSRVPQGGKTGECVFRSVVGPGHLQHVTQFCSGPSVVLTLVVMFTNLNRGVLKGAVYIIIIIKRRADRNYINEPLKSSIRCPRILELVIVPPMCPS